MTTVDDMLEPPQGGPFDKLRDANDAFRRSCESKNVLWGPGMEDQPLMRRAAILAAVRADESDPQRLTVHGQGIVTYNQESFAWMILFHDHDDEPVSWSFAVRRYLSIRIVRQGGG